MKRNGSEQGEEAQTVWPKSKITVKGLVDRMSAGREDLSALFTQRGVHIPGRELDFGHTAVQTSSAPGHLLSRMSTRLVFRDNAAICIPSAETGYPSWDHELRFPCREVPATLLTNRKGFQPRWREKQETEPQGDRVTAGHLS